MKKFKQTRFLFEYVLLKIFLFFLRLMPFNLSCVLAEQLCRLAARISHKRFEGNVKDIMLALPGTTEKQARRIAADSWKNMGRILIETVRFSHMKKEKLFKYIEFKNLDIFQKLAADKKGAIAHTGHFTNWEAFGLAASAAGIEKAVIAQHVENPYIDKEIKALRNTFGGKIISPRKPFFPSIKWLKQGKIMGILSDQNAYQSEVFTKFLGRWCASSPLTALLALKTGVPIHPVKIYRKNGKIIIEILPAVEIPQKPFSQELVLEVTNSLNKYYEDWIKENPASWLWAHKRWKREKDALRALKTK